MLKLILFGIGIILGLVFVIFSKFFANRLNSPKVIWNKRSKQRNKNEDLLEYRIEVIFG
ncbi:MAG: hypothetical protein PQJ44_08505 [Sphaerochaetaceae bacterium]|nr:hypothetical protein [Sphaerochaetaceae bacterium]